MCHPAGMLFLILGCVEPDPGKPGGPSDSGAPDTDTAPDDTGDSGDSGDTGLVWTTLPASCEAPGALVDDPLVLEGEARVTQTDRSPFLEALDVELDGDVAWIVGQGGLLSFDVSDPSAPVVLKGAEMSRYHRVEVLDGGRLATSHNEQGLYLWDATDPSSPSRVGYVSAPGLEGLAWVDGLLWVSVRAEGVRAYDVSNPAAPAERVRVGGLSAPWELASSGDGWLYAADAALGVVPIDIRDPDAPVVGAAVPLTGASALHARFVEGRLYVSAGGKGVYVLDATDRSAPTVLHSVTTGGSAVQADVADDRLWVVDHEGVMVFALGEGAPTPLQRDQTEQFALAVDAEGDRAFVGDWNLFQSWRITPGIDAGALELPSDTVRYTSAVAEVAITNRGSGTLALVGATVGDPSVTVEVSAITLGPGEAATLRLSNITADTMVCLASDDPDEPVRTLEVRSSAEPPAGVPAPDFQLQDLDGNVHRLSEQLGNPVLLAYFATW